MLAAGTLAQASFSALTVGLPVIAPQLRDHFGLSLTGVGLVLASEWVGTTLTLVAWGLLADRFGERLTLVAGLGGCAAATLAAGYAGGVASLVALLALAGAAGAAVNSASGRAVMGWFGAHERGLALGIRQTAIPLGGAGAAVALPLLAGAGGVRAALTGLAAVQAAAAVVAGLVVRDARLPAGAEAAPLRRTILDGRLWRLCWGSGLLLVAQVAFIGFLVLFLHDRRGLSAGTGAAVLAVVQVLAGVARIAAGRWSDRLRARVVPLRRVGAGLAVATLAFAALADAPLALLLPLLAVAGALSMAWNGLSFTAAAEVAGPARTGVAIGFQQTVLSIVGVGAPVAFAAAVEWTSWRAAFALVAAAPLVSWLVLRPLDERRGGTPRPRRRPRAAETVPAAPPG